MVSAVIMAGGLGTRFWPKSRIDNPKQFLKFFEDITMIQATVRRVAKIFPAEKIYIVTNSEFAPRIYNEIPEIPKENVLIEPFRRDTAACVGLAAVKISLSDPEEVMVVLPSDHYIGDETEFAKTLEIAVELAKEKDCLTTLGIKPTRPETGYGYIKIGERLSLDVDKPIYRVKEFTEKPDLKLAREFYTRSDYFWNSGIFIWKINVILDHISSFLPHLYQGLMKIKNAMGTKKEEEVLKEEYSTFIPISIDYGIMEKASEVYMVLASFVWDDMGNWAALERIMKSDKDGNIVMGFHLGYDTKNCIISNNDKFIATLGIENLIIIETEDVILICNKNRAQEVKDLRELIKSKSLDKFL
ncbi:mannose-1-phosphate guanylyltransferase [Anoxybacter fermentans]|uniref:mannose-1-phosphate guanylyltransferase n=1 Tax=Anoxybacter fermentans TaxID=1323375 RepID=A0A3S9SZU6_9FIRM|nr:mannose-1-phosphate guanylyltransferase [Anoxybacter fermentans]AZR73785.1 mannose-1-phosphate guanylyltransferase [Anoxybacter fermentans]